MPCHVDCGGYQMEKGVLQPRESQNIYFPSYFKFLLISYQHGPLKSPPFNMFFGTVGGVGEIYQTTPQDTHPMCTMTAFKRHYDLGALYFLDMWPFSDVRQMVINDPVCSLPRV